MEALDALHHRARRRLKSRLPRLRFIGPRAHCAEVGAQRGEDRQDSRQTHILPSLSRGRPTVRRRQSAGENDHPAGLLRRVPDTSCNGAFSLDPRPLRERNYTARPSPTSGAAEALGGVYATICRKPSGLPI